MKLYGDLPLSNVKSLLEQQYLLAYQTISIFGFDISTKNFPFVILFLTSLLIVSILFTIRNSELKKQKLFKANFDEDNILEFYINYNYLRFTCWVIVPIVLAVLSLPLNSLSTILYLVILAWTLVNAAIGFSCFKHSIAK